MRLQLASQWERNVLNKQRPVSALWKHAQCFITPIIKVINGGMEITQTGAK